MYILLYANRLKLINFCQKNSNVLFFRAYSLLLSVSAQEIFLCFTLILTFGSNLTVQGLSLTLQRIMLGILDQNCICHKQESCLTYCIFLWSFLKLFLKRYSTAVFSPLNAPSIFKNPPYCFTFFYPQRCKNE